MLKSMIVWALTTGAAIAAGGEYSAVARADAALRDAPVSSAGQIGVLPAGSTVTAKVCFDEGAYCFITGAGEGYVAGDLLTIKGDTNTVAAAEKARWNLIRKNREQSLADKFNADDIVVWGDSLSDQTFGTALEALLPGRKVSMQGVPGEDGVGIAKRMLADTTYTGRFKIIWDKHWTNEAPDQYLRELKPIIDRAAETGDYIVLSDIRQISGGDVDLVKDKQTTDEINREMARLYAGHFLDVSALLDPPNMRVGDGIHLTKQGNDAVAKALAAAIGSRQTLASK